MAEGATRPTAPGPAVSEPVRSDQAVPAPAGPDPAGASGDRAPGRQRRGMSLRARLVLLGTVGLVIAFVGGGVVLTLVLRGALERASDDAARQTAQEVVVLVNTNRLPNPVPSGGTTLVQVVDQQGRVLAASAGADRLVPALRADELAAALDGPATVPGSRFGVLGPVRVVALPAGPAADRSTVLVAAPAGDIDDTVRLVRTALIVGGAVLLAVLVAIAWRLVGATLRPVEALRAGAEKITGSGSTDTLPLPRSSDEIRRLAETLNDMLERLDASRRRQRAFVADAAHELRSPLASLRTQLDVAVATGEQPDLGDLLAEVDRMTRLAGDLLLLARADDAAPPPVAAVDIALLAEQTAARYAVARVPVTLRAAPIQTAQVNATAVGRVLTNVLDNAVRYAASAVTLTVGADPAGGVLVAVADDGPGIPENERLRVFERFARLDDARDRDSGGSGLGLAIAAELVRQQGGSITLTDAETNRNPPGLRVEIRLPAEPVTV